MNRLVFLFPGQGSQYVGMARDFYDKYSFVKDFFNLASEITSFDFANLCFSGPEDVLTTTRYVQPAMTLVNIACFEVLKYKGIHPAVVGGHSLGEYSALYAAEVLDFSQVMKLVQIRGATMQEAAEKEPGEMAAIMTLPISDIENICIDYGVEIANINSPEQIIITGTLEGIEKAMEACRERGARRCIRLNVSGPWHSRYMQHAQEELECAMEKEIFAEPQIPVICNVDANYLSSGNEARGKLSQQVCGSVLWLQSTEKLLRDDYKMFIEVGPKKVLSGLMRRISRDIVILQVEDSSSLNKLLTSLGNTSY